MRVQKMSAEELAAVLRRRFPAADASLEKDLAECEEAAGNDALAPKDGLRLVQALAGHAEKLNEIGKGSLVSVVSRVRI